MGFLADFKPLLANFKAKRAISDPKQRVRANALKNAEKQADLLKKPNMKNKAGRRIGSWFYTDNEGNEVFSPKQTGVNLAERITKGKANAFPVKRGKEHTLAAYIEALQAGEFDEVLLDISSEWGSKRKGSKPRRKRAGVRRRAK